MQQLRYKDNMGSYHCARPQLNRNNHELGNPVLKLHQRKTHDQW